ncbi:tyrosine recombinase XerC-like [Leptinotarsa decemlineata]|uniref:tyrosine recombinase XerC-like n=1 Tax=Leptinotarsa decemlineata TaxID=7539 RepID=UPI003D308EF4
MDSDHSDIRSTPPDVMDAANEASKTLLPQKSLSVYENTYEKFMAWRKTKNINSFSENVILAYLSELSKNFKAATLWSNFSMLKSTISIKKNINIDYPKVRAFLKRKSEGYVPKKSRVLEKEQILKFIQEAPDEKFLLTKVILIFGLAGALRRDELYKLKLYDIEDLGTILIVNVHDTKTKISRKFTITEHLELYRKYKALRPQKYAEKKIFIDYQGGKCTCQIVGITKIGKVPSVIAKYLNLPHAEQYTGHCFRRSSATLLVEAGGDLLTLKKHGGWKSSAVAEHYIENSITQKIDVANKILSPQNQISSAPIATTSIISTSKSRNTLIEKSNAAGANATNDKSLKLSSQN